MPFRIPALIGVLLLLAGSPGSAQDLGNAVAWPIADGGNGHWYEVVVVPEGISWQEANDRSQARGGHLATIISAAENRFVFGLTLAKPSCWDFRRGRSVGPWLGGRQTRQEADPAAGWSWVNGEGNFSFTCWAPGEPNGGNGIGFLGFYQESASGAEFWNDMPNEHPLYPVRGFVVEYEPVSGPDPT